MQTSCSEIYALHSFKPPTLEFVSTPINEMFS